MPPRHPSSLTDPVDLGDLEETYSRQKTAGGMESILLKDGFPLFKKALCSF